MTKLLNAAAGLALAAYTDAELGVRNDLRLGYAFARATIKHHLRQFKDHPSLYHFFDDTVRSRSEGIAYVYQGKEVSWKEASLQVRKIAHLLLGQGLKSGGTCSVLTSSSVVVVCWWGWLLNGVGFSRSRVVGALRCVGLAWLVLLPLTLLFHPYHLPLSSLNP